MCRPFLFWRLPADTEVAPVRKAARIGITPGIRKGALWLVVILLAASIAPARAVILWSDLRTILAHETGPGQDILSGAVKRDDAANDTLYFKFHVNPLSDASTEEYFAAFELYEADAERLAIGNAPKAWAYSAFSSTDETSETNTLTGYIDLHSSRPEPFVAGNFVTYQNPHRGVEATIVVKIQYVPDGDDLITVWLNPDLGPGANEIYQPESLTTRFSANASFDEIRLRHGGLGDGWRFSELAIASSFADFVDASSANPDATALTLSRNSLLYDLRSWQKEPGLPVKPVHALAQTRDGYLWLGSEEGLARFDGLRFVPWAIREGTRIGPVRALLDDGSGALWIGSATNGLMRWREGTLTAWGKRDGLPSDTITSLAEDDRGRLWIGTASGLCAFENGRLQTLKAAEQFTGTSISALCKDNQGNIWLGADGEGIFELLHDEFVPVPGDSVKDLLAHVHCLLVDHTGDLWAGSGDDFVLRRSGGQWHRHRFPQKSATAYVRSLVEERDGTIWAGLGGGGLAQFKGGKFIPLTASRDLAGNLVECLLVDREGSLWAGTEAGLNQVRRRKLFALGQGEGLGYGAVQSLMEVAPGVVWASKSNDGLHRWDGRTFNQLNAAGLAPGESQINAFLAARDGSCWVARSGGLLRYKDPRAATDESTLFELPGVTIIALAEDATGTVLVGTREGQVWQLREGLWIGLTNLWQNKAITVLLPAPDGSVWLGTDGAGVFRSKDGTLERIAKNKLGQEAIGALYLDAQGAVWIGAASAGLSRWRNGQIDTFTAGQGLPDNGIRQILEDATDRFWLGTKRGITCISRKELDQVAAGAITLLHPQVYGRPEGMLSEECSAQGCPSALKTRSGLLWFSTAKGIAVVDPRSERPEPPAPAATLEEVLVDEAPVLNFESAPPARPGSKPLRIVPGKHRLEFRFSALNFEAPEQIQFRYRLDGLDPDWVQAGTRRTAFYGYVPPGGYRFHVAASNGKGVWTESSVSLPLTVLRHFWQSWWFVASAAFGLLFSVGSTVRIVEKNKLQSRLKRLEQERALEQERTRIAHDLHDEMGAKLCRISFLSEHARRGNLKPQELQDQIASISDASRDVLHSLDEIVWAVDPKNDTLEHVASYLSEYMQEYFQMTGIACELDIPTQVPPYPLTSQMRHHLFLAVHEAFTNILKHSKATRAQVSMTCAATQCDVVVSDNGRGFDHSTGAGNGNDDGLRNMQERLTAIGGSCQVNSQPGQGTVIRFTLPIPQLAPEKNSP
jgi:signal transduction histidine kinase/ligand-binding sensor domain-containing protein